MCCWMGAQYQARAGGSVQVQCFEVVPDARVQAPCAALTQVQVSSEPQAVEIQGQGGDGTSVGAGFIGETTDAVASVEPAVSGKG
jgi:hypothetical protein